MKQIAILCVLLVLAGCTKSAVPDWETLPDPEPYYSTEGDVDFITEILRQRNGDATSTNNTLVIEEEIKGISQISEKYREKGEKDLFRDAKRNGKKAVEALAACLAKNRKKETIKDFGILPFDYIVLTKEEKQRYFYSDPENGWKRFYEAYPKSSGILSFSRPGFSKDGTVAVIDLGHTSGPLGGKWGAYIYEKKDGKWRCQRTIGNLLVS